MSDGDWVEAASQNKALVVEILLKLSQEPPPPLPPGHSGLPAPPLSWTVRQRRSRPPLTPLPPRPASSDKRLEPSVASPSTPLSWSGAASVSAGAGVSTVDAAESGRTKNGSSGVARSKVTHPSETTPSKRSGKRKSLAQLRGDETMLMEEQQHLRRNVAALQSRFEENRKENEFLKMTRKMMLDTQVQLQGESSKAVTLHGTKQTIAAEVVPAENDRVLYKPRENKFVIPDLNSPAMGY